MTEAIRYPAPRRSSVKVNNLSLSFGEGETATKLFEDVSFEVQKGEILGILGGNGTGKTSLLRLISGLYPTTSGSIDSAENIVFSWIPQDFSKSFFPWASLLQNIHLTVSESLAQLGAQKEKIQKIQKELGVDIDVSLRPDQCSGGMLQQAALIRSFVSEADVIFADEPFSALDMTVKRKVRRNFRRIVKKSSKAAVVILHDLDDLVSLCDRVLIIPGKPYSSKSKSGFEKLKFLINDQRDDDKSGSDVSILSVAERVFSEAKES